MKNKTEDYGCKTDLIGIDWNNGKKQERIVLVIDWDDAEVYCMSRGISDGCPMDVWHGLRWFVNLPMAVDATLLYDWIDEEIMPVVSEYEPYFNTRWDGSNWIADWGAYHDERIRDKISRICASAPCTENGGIWDAVDWLAYGSCDNLGISATTTDNEISQMVADIRDDAEYEGVILIDLEEYLFDMRSEKIEEHAERLYNDLEE